MLVAFVGVGLIYGAYNAAAAMTYAGASEAHLAKHCSDAVGRYQWVAGFFALSLATPRGEAARRRDECRAVVDAQKARDSGDYRAAVDAYEAAIDANPDSPIESTLERWYGESRVALGDQLVDRAFRLTDESLLAEAAEIYLDAHRDGRGTSVASRAASSAMRMGGRLEKETRIRPCRAMTYYSALPSDFDSWTDERLPRALYRCGWEHRAAKRYGQAERVFTQLIGDFPDDKLVGRARRALIGTEVAEVRAGRVGPLPSPEIVGYSKTGDVDVTVQNASPYPLELLLSGPTARKVVVPKCASCKERPRGSPPSACSGPQRTITVAGGRYAIVVRSSAEDVRNWTGDRSLTDGYRYDLGCLYIVTG